MTTCRSIDVGGAEVFYREGGERAAPALLLLHGFPSSSAQYQSLMDRLEDRYRVIAPDYPGFGQSASLEGTTTFDRLADAIDGFVDSIGLERSSLCMFDFVRAGWLSAGYSAPRARPGTRAGERQRLRRRSRAELAGAAPVGENDRFFPPDGARAYLEDLPEAELHLLDTGHFATATHNDEIAELIADFLGRRVTNGDKRRIAAGGAEAG